MMQSSRKPPLPRSPIHLRLRPRRAVLQPNSDNTQTPPGSLIKTQLPKTASGIEEPDLRPEYSSISCELRALAKMVNQEFSSSNKRSVVDDAGFPSSWSADRMSPLFERGRLYEEYAARRNERLKRKKGWETADGKKAAAGYESAKRRDTNNSSTKRFESLRKTIVPSCTTTATTTTTPVSERGAQSSSSSRYLLRSSTSSKENKVPLPSAVNAEKKIGVRRARKK